MNISKILATCFYLGRLPFAPGSWGSLGALLIWALIPLNYIVHISLILILFVIGLVSSEIVSKTLNIPDPPEIVIDEAVGMGISLFMVPHSIILYVLAFFIFRIFDIFKPSFIYHLQNFSGAWGIMLDDVFAGLFTLAIVQGIASII